MNKTKLRRKSAVQAKNKREIQITLPRRSSRKRQEKTCEVSEWTRSVSSTKNCSSIRNAKKKIIEVVKCISGWSDSSAGICNTRVGCESESLSKKLSDESVIYVGTTYCRDMPRKDSVVDLTKSDTTLPSSWDSHSLDNYDISGDNIVDELQLKDQSVTSSVSIFTIFPPKSQSLFATPSDELCICRQNSSRKLLKNRHLSLTDVPSVAEKGRKRISVSRNRLNNTETESTDCIWKLKKSYPLTNGLCQNERSSSSEHMEINSLSDLRSDVNIMNIVDELQVGFSISNLNVDLVDGMQSSKTVNSATNDV